jgi:hypothetical protein
MHELADLDLDLRAERVRREACAARVTAAASPVHSKKFFDPKFNESPTDAGILSEVEDTGIAPEGTGHRAKSL